MQKPRLRPIAVARAVRPQNPFLKLAVYLLIWLTLVLYIGLITRAHAMAGPGLPGAEPSTVETPVNAAAPDRSKPHPKDAVSHEQAVQMMVNRRAHQEDAMFRSFVGFLPF